MTGNVSWKVEQFRNCNFSFIHVLMTDKYRVNFSSAVTHISNVAGGEKMSALFVPSRGCPGVCWFLLFLTFFNLNKIVAMIKRVK